MRAAQRYMQVWALPGIHAHHETLACSSHQGAGLSKAPMCLCHAGCGAPSEQRICKHGLAGAYFVAARSVDKLQTRC